MFGPWLHRVTNWKGPIGLWIFIILLLPAAAAAHPLDEYYQVTTIKMAPNRITLAVELYPAVLVAPQLLPLMDTDGDETLSETEQHGYIDRFLADLSFEVDGRPLPLTVGTMTFPSFLDIRAGGSVIRFDLYADLPAAHRGDHHLFYQNNHQPEVGIYVVQAQSETPEWVYINEFERDVFQSSIDVAYTIAAEAPVEYGVGAALAGVEVAEAVTTGQERLAGYLYDPNLSGLWLLVGLGLAVMLGGLHALTPGHGKTLVAAYLIGSRGTIGHAVTLGGIVTFTHTISVIVIGLLALLASQFILPNVLVPALEIASGLLVLYLGLRLLWSRWQAYQKGEQGGDDHYPHDHEHHHLPEQVKWSDLLTLGVSGGLVPCPEALGIMLIAIGLNRILLGLGLIVAFSFGLAAVLIVIGILLVRSKSFLERLGSVGGRWQTALPLLSAVIVTLLGLGIVIKGLWPWLG